jgi:uncharacterized protein (TIGR03790 family)
MRFLACAVFCALVPFQAAALDARQLAVVINTRDPLSVQIGEYYAARRAILFQNILRVEFNPQASLAPGEFAEIRKRVDAQAGATVQAYALAWALPYRVGCMSITAAFAFGYDPAYCEPGCKPTLASRYFNSPSRRPHGDLGVRPAMALAAKSFEEAKALIERGVAADGTRPPGTAYLVSTADPHRNVRSPFFRQAERVAKGRLALRRIAQDRLTHRTDVLFYLTGAAHVGGLETLRFRPGAIADHLTSAGGVLDADAGGQMTVLRWLEAGATGSYGTVVEPCNLPQKFPHPAILIGRYLQGETLIEAYWKSVRMPGQGLFVGEPLAAPFRG